MAGYLWRRHLIAHWHGLSEEASGFGNSVPLNAKDPLHDLLLATTAIVESETEAIDRTLQQEIAAKLIQTYEQAQRGKRFEECEKIEQVMSGWLLSLSKEAYKPPVLQALEAAIRDVAQPALQCAVLTSLIMIGQQLTKGSSAIFSQLVPPMLALTGLPAVGQFQPLLAYLYRQISML